MAVDMRNTVRVQYLPILRPKESGIPDLYGIFELVRELAEKAIEFGAESGDRLIVTLKLKEKRPGTILELSLSKWCQNQVIEKLCIKETRIRFAGLQAIPWVRCENRYGDLFPDFETHRTVWWHLVAVGTKLLACWWPVEGGIIADCTKEQ
jgi:hypothetical protein